MCFPWVRFSSKVTESFNGVVKVGSDIPAVVPLCVQTHTHSIQPGRHVTMTWLRLLSGGTTRGTWPWPGSGLCPGVTSAVMAPTVPSPLFIQLCRKTAFPPFSASVSKFRRFCICALCNLLQESCFEAPTWMFHGYQSEQGRKKENIFFFNYYLKFIFFCRNVLCTHRLHTW